MYQAYGLLLPNSEFTLDGAARKLAAVFPDYDRQDAPGGVVFTGGSWEFHLVLRQGPEVLEDSVRIAGGIGGDQDDLGLSRCDRRVEMSSDYPDPEMDHFDDFLKIVEVLKGFPGLVAVEPKEPSLL